MGYSDNEAPGTGGSGGTTFILDGGDAFSTYNGTLLDAGGAS